VAELGLLGITIPIEYGGSGKLGDSTVEIEYIQMCWKENDIIIIDFMLVEVAVESFIEVLLPYCGTYTSVLVICVGMDASALCIVAEEVPSILWR
jgi:hypothetical protein